MGRWNLGYCPVCERKTLFLEFDSWLRDYYRCLRCLSIPRQRALKLILDETYGHWRTLHVHESSPGGSLSQKIQTECSNYMPTQYYANVSNGCYVGKVRSENLEQQTFGDAMFDIVVTQDVLEHVLHPTKAFSEIARTLKPGGAHIFTVPYYADRNTEIRAKEQDGEIVHLKKPEFHRNPIDPRGSLVTVDWGKDLAQIIKDSSGLETEQYVIRDRTRGIDGEFLEVFVSRKRC